MEDWRERIINATKNISDISLALFEDIPLKIINDLNKAYTETSIIDEELKDEYWIEFDEAGEGTLETHRIGSVPVLLLENAIIDKLYSKHNNLDKIKEEDIYNASIEVVEEQIKINCDGNSRSLKKYEVYTIGQVNSRFDADKMEMLLNFMTARGFILYSLVPQKFINEDNEEISNILLVFNRTFNTLLHRNTVVNLW